MADLAYLNNALLYDNNGVATAKHELVKSNDFDDIRQWSDKVYLPYRVNPLGNNIRPQSSLHALKVGSMTISRFSYGIPVHLDEFSTDTQVGMVLTTINGGARHWQNAYNSVETGSGESFVVDNSQTDYVADFNPYHLQLNVTFTHSYLDSLFTKITGRQAPADLWLSKVKFGSQGSDWISVLEYAVKMMNGSFSPVLETHMEEALGTNILIQWAAACGFDLERCPQTITPGYIIKAESYMRENASSAPTLSEIAMAVGVSGRAIHNGFKKYRNTTPMKFLRELRLEGIKAELEQAPPHITVAQIAYGWGYGCLSRFANVYKQLFGELPSDTRRRAI